MKKFLQIMTLIAVLAAVIAIPDQNDRICGIIAYAGVFGPFAGLWIAEHRDQLFFLMLLPVFIICFAAKKIWIRLLEFDQGSRLTPEEEDEIMINHFDEPWGIGAW